MTNTWNWLDGDIGRYKHIDINNAQCVVELAPKYKGRGQYSVEWYLQMYPLAETADKDFDGGGNIINQDIPILAEYITNENGDEHPDPEELDAKADFIISQLKLCNLCKSYFFSDDPEEEICRTH